jgi:hypothetical protein
VAAVGEAGALPGVGPGAAVSGGIRGTSYRVGLGALLLTSRRAESAVAGAGANLRFFSVGPSGCFTVGGLSGPGVEGCAGLEVGKISGEGVGEPILETGSAWWAAASASGALIWPLFGGLAGRVELQAALPLVRPRFVIGGIGELHRPSPVTGRGALGLEWRF